MNPRRGRVVLGLFSVPLLGLLLAAPACSATKAVFKGAIATEEGKDGWRKGGVSGGKIEAIRGSERVVIESGRVPDTYVVKIDPKSLAFPTPPWGDARAATDPMGLQGEARVYRIPRGRSWNDVHAWYLAWFDFKPMK